MTYAYGGIDPLDTGAVWAEQAGETGEEPIDTIYVVKMEEKEAEFSDHKSASDCYFDLITELEKAGSEAGVELIERNYFDRSEWEDEMEEEILLCNY